MKFLLKLLRGKKARGRFKKKPTSRLFFAVAIISFSFLGLITLFMLQDEFMLYIQLLVFNQNERRGDAGYTIDDSTGDIVDEQGNTVSSGIAGLSPSAPGVDSSQFELGSVGIPLMLANKMNGGYLKDWIQISEDHLTYKYWPDRPKMMLGGKPWSPSILLMISTSLAETGMDKGYLPVTVLVRDKYNTVPHYNLREANSALLAELGRDYINSRFTMELVESNYYTQFQMSMNMGNITPLGKLHVEGEGAAEGYLPSLMNGYKVPTGTVRGLEDTDFGYFPDQVCSMLKSSVQELTSACDMNMLSERVAEAVAYAAHNGGPGTIKQAWAIGGNPGKDVVFTQGGRNDKFGYYNGDEFDKYNTVSKKEIASSVINDLEGPMKACLDYLTAQPNPEKVFMFDNHADYEGMEVMSLLATGEWFIASETAMNNLKTRIQQGGWLRGALVGYRAVTKKYDAEEQDVLNFVNNLQIKSVDTSKYGTVYVGKYGEQSRRFTEVVVHKYSTQYNIYNQAGEGPMPALHAVNSESARGLYMGYIGASYIYWKMLINSGVEVATWGEAYADAIGRTVIWKQKPQPAVVPEIDKLTPGVSVPLRQKTDGSYFSDDAIGPFSSNMEGQYCNSPMYNRSAYTVLGGSVGIHGGEDFPVSNNTQLLACGSGVIAVSEYNEGGYGNYIIINLDKKDEEEPQVSICYGHLNKRYVSVGDRVEEGEVIGLSGSTGNSGGPHLHIEIRVERAGHTMRVPYYAVVLKRYFPVQYAPAAWYTRKQESCHVYGADGNLLAISGLTGEQAKFNGLTDIAEIAIGDAPERTKANYDRIGIGLWFGAERELNQRLSGAG